MTGWRLSFKVDYPEQLHGVLDGSALRPDKLASLSQDRLLAVPFSAGDEELALGDVFDADRLSENPAEPATSRVLEVDGCDRFMRLGAGMADGRLEVHGHGGDLVGTEMIGGAIRVRGDVGRLAGAAMSGGLLKVEGNAGDLVGAAPSDEAHGLRGGEILITGNGGARVGWRQRGGLIAVAGRVGDFVGHELHAGTILVARGDVNEPGVRMRRGSIVALGSVAPLPDGFRREGPVQPLWLRLLRRRFETLGLALDDESSRLLWGTIGGSPMLEAWTGDTHSLDRGEILVPLRGTQPS